jgi:hypothetical protein
MKKQLVSEVKQFQKLAGILKEYIESDPETITQAFQQAGIELDKPVVYICDYGNPGGTDKPVKVLGGKLLRELEAERKRDEEGNPDYNEEEGITYEYGPHQGGGELLGDYTPEAVEGLKCKLNVYFSDSHLYEIWQAGEMNEWHPDDPSSVDLDDMEDEDPEDFDDVSEDADYESESGDTNAMGDTDAMDINEDETPEEKAARQWMWKMVWTLVDRGEDQIKKMYQQGGYQYVYNALKQSFLGALKQQGKDTSENQDLLDKSLVKIFRMMGFVKSHKGEK